MTLIEQVLNWAAEGSVVMIAPVAVSGVVCLALDPSPSPVVPRTVVRMQ